MILILYGPPGAGKNFVGEWLARNFHYHFYDADIDLTWDMKQNLRHQQPFTQRMRDHFFNIVANKMQVLKKRHPRLVMAQALSRKVNREQLRHVFPEACFIHIDASCDIRSQRLADRGDWVTPDWVDNLLKQQEPATEGHLHLDNSKDYSHLYHQIIQWDFALFDHEKHIANHVLCSHSI